MMSLATKPTDGDARERPDAEGEGRGQDGGAAEQAAQAERRAVMVVGGREADERGGGQERAEDVGVEVEINRVFGGDRQAADRLEVCVGGDDGDGDGREQEAGVGDAGMGQRALDVRRGERREVAGQQGQDGEAGEQGAELGAEGGERAGDQDQYREGAGGLEAVASNAVVGVGAPW